MRVDMRTSDGLTLRVEITELLPLHVSMLLTIAISDTILLRTSVLYSMCQLLQAYEPLVHGESISQEMQQQQLQLPQPPTQTNSDELLQHHMLSSLPQLSQELLRLRQQRLLPIRLSLLPLPSSKLKDTSRASQKPILSGMLRNQDTRLSPLPLSPELLQHQLHESLQIPLNSPLLHLSSLK